MRVLVMNWRDKVHPAAGGAEVYTEEVLQRWAEQGHEVTLFCAAVDGQPADETLDGVRRVRRGSRLGVYRAARRWYRSHGRGQFDLVVDEVNTHPFFAHEFVDDTPVVALFHQTCEEIWSHQMRAPLSWLGRRVLEPRWLNRMRRVPALAVSESTRTSIARFGIENVVLVPEGLTLPSNLAPVPKASTPTLVHVSRLVAYKRADHVIEAVRIARQTMPELRLWVVGSGPDEESLRATAPEGVEFFGFVPTDKKLELMASAHAIVMASVREGWGLVIAEAASLGTRAIAYDRPGLRDAVSATDGVLVPPTPEALAAWIVATLPGWMENPPAAVPDGGVHHWDVVAERVMDAVCLQAGISAPRSMASQHAA